MMNTSFILIDFHRLFLLFIIFFIVALIQFLSASNKILERKEMIFQKKKRARLVNNLTISMVLCDLT